MGTVPPGVGTGESMKIVLATLISLLFSLPLYAQDTYPEFESGLRLSPPQKMRAEQIRRRYMGEMRSLQQESLNRRLELRELRRDNTQNRERMHRLRREIHDIEASRGNIYNQYRSDLEKTLDKRQRERFNSFCDKEHRRGVRRFRPKGYER